MKKFIFRLIISSLLIIPLYYYGKFILSNNIQITGLLSYFYLFFVLLISPISYIFYKIKYLKKYANTITGFRRPIGIITGILTLFHLLKFEEKIYTLWEKYYSSKLNFLEFLYDSIFNDSTGTILGMNNYSFWLGTIGFILMMILLFTSNNISQKILGAKVWKNIQKLVFPLYVIVVLHIYFIGGWKGVYLFPALILILSRLYVTFDKNFIYKGSTHNTITGYRKFLCLPCGFIYDEELGDPDGGLLPGTKFEEIPDTRRCPVCGVTKKDFTPLDGKL